MMSPPWHTIRVFCTECYIDIFYFFFVRQFRIFVTSSNYPCKYILGGEQNEFIIYQNLVIRYWLVQRHFFNEFCGVKFPSAEVSDLTV